MNRSLTIFLFIALITIDLSAEVFKGRCLYVPNPDGVICTEVFFQSKKRVERFENECREKPDTTWSGSKRCPSDDRIVRCDNFKDRVNYYYRSSKSPIDEQLGELKFKCQEGFRNLTTIKPAEPVLPDSVEIYKKALDEFKTGQKSLEEVYLKGQLAAQDFLKYLERVGAPVFVQEQVSNIHIPGFHAQVDDVAKWKVKSSDYQLLAKNFGKTHDVDFFNMLAKIYDESGYTLVTTSMVSSTQACPDYGSGDFLKMALEIYTYSQKYPINYATIINDYKALIKKSLLWTTLQGFDQKALEFCGKKMQDIHRELKLIHEAKVDVALTKISFGSLQKVENSELYRKELLEAEKKKTD